MQLITYIIWVHRHSRLQVRTCCLSLFIDPVTDKKRYTKNEAVGFCYCYYGRYLAYVLSLFFYCTTKVDCRYYKNKRNLTTKPRSNQTLEEYYGTAVAPIQVFIQFLNVQSQHHSRASFTLHLQSQLIKRCTCLLFYSSTMNEDQIRDQRLSVSLKYTLHGIRKKFRHFLVTSTFVSTSILFWYQHFLTSIV